MTNISANTSNDPIWQAGYNAAINDHLEGRKAEEAATVAYIAAKTPEIAEAMAADPLDISVNVLREAVARVNEAFVGLQAADETGDEATVNLWDDHADFANLLLTIAVSKFIEARAS